MPQTAPPHLARFGAPPASLDRGLARIEARLHAALTAHPKVGPERAANACIIASLSVRDALVALGVSARVRACRLHLQATGSPQAPPRELLIGAPEATDDPGHWNGHLVVLAHGFLIDPTLAQARRPRWPDLPDMVALPLIEHDPLTRLDNETGGVSCRWLPLDDAGWSAAPDARSTRRRRLVRELLREPR